jgi:hypothetical protein
MATRLTSFVHLQEISIEYAVFPNPICAALKDLPNLRHVALRFCTFGSLGNSIPPTALTSAMYLDNIVLPIPELTIWKCMREFERQDGASPYIHLLKSISGPQLRILRIDWTILSANFFSQQISIIEYEVPVNLEILEIRLPKFSAWTGGNTLQNLLEPLKVCECRSVLSLACQYLMGI